MNYTKKSEEVFAELFQQNWMTANDWNTFKKRAEKKVKRASQLDTRGVL